MSFMLSKSTAYDYNNADATIPTSMHPRPEPTLIIPSFMVSLSNHIVSFILRKTSHFPLIGTKNGDIRRFEVDELHIIILLALCGAIHVKRKWRARCEEYQRQLAELLVHSKLHNFETLAAVDDNNGKRIECMYYKQQLQFYDIDLYSRMELRSFMNQTLSQIELLSGLSIKILESLNSLFRRQQLVACKNKRLRQKIAEHFDSKEDLVDKFQSFFDEKNNEQYFYDMREKHRIVTEKEVGAGYEHVKQEQQSDINAQKKKLQQQQQQQHGDDQKLTEEEDNDEEQPESLLQKRVRLSQIQTNFDHEYLKTQAQNLPIQSLNFNGPQITRYNIQKQVNQIKYDIVLQQDMERRQQKIRKFGIYAGLTLATAVAYWYNRIYEGQPVTQRIRDTKARYLPFL